MCKKQDTKTHKQFLFRLSNGGIVMSYALAKNKVRNMNDISIIFVVNV